MFTGIIESQGIIKEITRAGTNQSFWIESPISSEFRVDQSISHNGVCLTIEQVTNNTHKITAIRETLMKTNLRNTKINDIVNLERSMVLNGRIDGHIVQGHVDCTGECLEREEIDGSWQYTIGFAKEFTHLIIEKGSVCINGISLTVFNAAVNSFTVGIVPYTYENTNISHLKIGDKVNLEFDVIGKYIYRNMQLRRAE